VWVDNGDVDHTGGYDAAKAERWELMVSIITTVQSSSDDDDYQYQYRYR
jgi:hypothetical protein